MADRTPVRLQLCRKKGFNLLRLSMETNGLEAVVVDRRTKWGNPCRIGMFRDYTAADAVRDYRKWVERDLSVASFDNAFGKPPTIEDVQSELGGKNLACSCPLDQPCHADVLLELANTPTGEE